MPIDIFARTNAQQTVKQVTMNAIGAILRHIAGDELRLLETVAAGPYHFRVTVLRASHGLAIDDHVANLMYAFLERKVKERYPTYTPKQALDSLEVLTPHVPTQEEIDNGWEIESASSPEANKKHYADLPSGLLSKMKFHRT